MQPRWFRACHFVIKHVSFSGGLVIGIHGVSVRRFFIGIQQTYMYVPRFTKDPGSGIWNLTDPETWIQGWHFVEGPSGSWIWSTQFWRDPLHLGSRLKKMLLDPWGPGSCSESWICEQSSTSFTTQWTPCWYPLTLAPLAGVWLVTRPAGGGGQRAPLRSPKLLDRFPNFKRHSIALYVNYP